MEKEPKYISLLIDVGFKIMFGEKNKKFLIAFLNSLLSKSIGTIEDLTYLNPEQLGENTSEKKMIFDIYCITAENQHIIVELQVGHQSYYGERAVTYVSRLVSNLAEKGVKRYSIPPIYSINLLNFRMPVFKDKQEFLWEVQLKDQRNNVFLPQIKFVFIELCIFARLFQRSELREELHRWLYIINNMGSNEDVQECPFEESIYQDFFEQGLFDKLSVMEKEAYAKSIFEYQDVKDTIEFEREDARAEGIAEGEARGEARGRAEGKAEGIAEGKAEGIAEGIAEATLALAKSMFERGIDLDTIISITGLTAEQLRA